MSQLSFHICPVTVYAQNCSILVCQETNAAAIVDPGGDLPAITELIDRIGCKIEKILITHGHVDHAGSTAQASKQFGVNIYGPHREDLFWIEGLQEHGMMIGVNTARPFVPDQWLNDGDKVTVGNCTLDVVHCPGHTPGHVVFVHPQSKLAVVGDVLFDGSIGRTDFPKGNYDQLIHSIREKLFSYAEDTTFIPGHGPTSTFGEQKQSNPFVADHLF